MSVPLERVVLPDHPPEWRVPTEEEIDIALERDEFGLLTVRAKRMRRKLDMERWYLVQNIHRLPADNNKPTGRVEMYISRFGVEWPVFGIWGVYRVIEKVVGNEAWAKQTVRTAIMVGAIETISVEKARDLYDATVIASKPSRGWINIQHVESALGPRPGGWDDVQKRKGG